MRDRLICEIGLYARSAYMRVYTVCVYFSGGILVIGINING